MTPRSLVALAVVLALPSLSPANVADVAKAARILEQIAKIMAKYQQYSANLKAPPPIANSTGTYVLPYHSSGAMTEWATKTLNIQVGAMAGEKAGEVAGNALASRVPFGGLLSGVAKKKGKEIGAVAAVGGTEFIKKSSDQSFNNLDDYAVYLHVAHSSEGGYSQALAAAMAIYPSLEKTYDAAIKKAFEQAAKNPAAGVAASVAATSPTAK
jgi:hypothetical protein